MCRETGHLSCKMSGDAYKERLSACSFWKWTHSVQTQQHLFLFVLSSQEQLSIFSFKISTTWYVPVEILDLKMTFITLPLYPTRYRTQDSWWLGSPTVQASMLSLIFLVVTFSLPHELCKSCQAQRDSCLGCRRPFWVPQDTRGSFPHTP